MMKNVLIIKCCHADFTSVSDPFTCWLSQGVLKRGLLGIFGSTSFAACNFGNTSAMRVILFLKYLKLNVHFRNGGKNWENEFCFLDNCICIGCVKFSLYEQNTCHQQWMG